MSWLIGGLILKTGSSPLPLRNRKSSTGELIPYRVFGFPVLNEDLEAWAKY